MDTINTHNSELEELKLKSLKWQIGFRRFLTPAVLIALIGGYFGFYSSYQNKIKDEKFQQLIQHLNSPYRELRIEAIHQLKEFGDRSYLHLRMALKTNEDPIVRAHLLDVLPDNFGIEDKIEYSHFKENLEESHKNGEQTKVEGQDKWIWLGNYYYTFDKWIEKFLDLPFPSTVDFDSLKKYSPAELKGKVFQASRDTNIRSHYPEGETAAFAPQIGLLRKGDLIKIIDFKKVDHPRPQIKRIWAKIERLK